MYIRLSVTSESHVPLLFGQTARRLVTRSNVMTKAISPGDSCFVNLVDAQVIHERLCDNML